MVQNKQAIYTSFLPLCTDAAARSHSLWVSHVLYIRQAQALTAFAPDYLFKNICIINNLGRKSVFLWSKEQARLLSIIKGLSSLISGFLSTVWAGVTLLKLELKEPVRENAGSLVTVIVMNHKVLSLTHGAHLLPAFMKPWQQTH